MSNLPSPPGPRGHWLLGNLKQFRGEKLAFYMRLAREHGDVAGFRLGPRRLVLLSHPDFIEQVLVGDNRNFVKHFVMRLLQPVLGNGLLMSEGDFWLRQRRLMQPAFQRQRIDSYGAIFVDHAGRMLSAWQDGSTRDLHADMTQLALGIVAKALLDAEIKAAHEVGEVMRLLLDDFTYRFEGFLTLPKWLPTPWNLRVNRARERLKAIIQGVIHERRREARDRGDLLSMLIAARDSPLILPSPPGGEGGVRGDDGGGMTDAQLRDEVMTLFLAGHDTTANALTWTWYLLAHNPDVESKLLAELREVLGERLPTVADLPHLAFAERVILEAMRLYPPVYAFGREAIRDCVIGGFHIPAGMTLLMSQWVVHRDPRFFDEPDRFHPDRWAGDLMKRLPKYAYFPFGGGPRVCIGNTFAMLEAILVLVTIAPRFQLRLAPGETIQPWPSVTLRPRHGMRMILTRRGGTQNMLAHAAG